MDVAMGYALPRALHVVTEAGVPDALGDDPRPAADLAAATGTDAGALARMLRLLAAHGLFEACEGGFRHTEASRLLRADHPFSMRPFVRLQGLRSRWDIWGHLGHALRTGATADRQALPEGWWAHLAAHPDDRAIFDEAMTKKVHAQIAGILGACDFRRFGTIADIGGGQGHLLAAILDAAPAVRGILFDLPEVVGGVEPPQRLGGRLLVQPGSFFEGPLPRADAYLLTQVLHNWDDEGCLRLLRGIREAAAPGARLLAVEWLIPEDGRPNWTLLVDLIMLAEYSGRERTEPELAALLSASGFRLDRTVDCGLRSFILEGVAV